MADKDKINDIIAPIPGEKIKPIDLLEFFPTSKVKAIKLSQYNIFCDIYQELENTIDLSKRQKISIKKFKKDECLDLIKKETSQKPFSLLLKYNKKRVLLDPINILSPLQKVRRNTLDIRNLEIMTVWKTYADFYVLPLAPQQVVKKFYKKNQDIIKKWLSKWAIITITTSAILLSITLVIVGYKNYLEAELKESYKEIYNLKNIRNPQELLEKSSNLSSRFTKLKVLYFPVDLLWNNFIYSNSKIRTAWNLIYWWKEVTKIASVWWDIWTDIDNEVNELRKIRWNEKLEWLALINKIKLTDFFKKEYDNLDTLDEYLNSSIHYYSQVDTLWDKTLDDKFSSTLESLMKIEKYIKFIIDNKEQLLRLAWDTKPTRYFILNQNKDEIRANWWFPWSVITVELYKWNVITYDKKDIYYYDWHLTPYRETPPEWLNIISPNHWLRDANYNPVFLDSVNKINFFYEKAGWWTIDTVIAINQWLIEDLLAKYWPIFLDEIQTNITDRNFSLIMSTLVENKFQKVISPKDILFKFSEKLEKKLIEKKDYLNYFQIFLNNLEDWEINIASRDKDIQEYIDKLWFLEKWRTDNWNWIYPVFTSISWNKSDRYVKRDFRVISTKSSWCEVNNEFLLKSTHTYNTETRDEIRKVFDELKITDGKERDRLIAIEWAWENRQFVRILTPKWSKITDKKWNSISIDDNDSRYTIMKFYLNTDVWEAKEIKFNYSSTPKNCTPKINFYKQSWLSNYTFSSK